MDITQKERLKIFIDNNKYLITGRFRNIIKDNNERSLKNIRDLSGLEIDENIKTIYDLLIHLDTNGGICERNGCNNIKSSKKRGNKYSWILNKFCSDSCSRKNFAIHQKGVGNTSHRMSPECKISMGEKISKRIRERIANNLFTPNITNSWCHSKIKIIIDNKERFVRSSWEAYFYILNPHLYYEFIRIPYYDEKKGFFRNYIVDFYDSEKKIIYEIKPYKKLDECLIKINAAKEWCINNKCELVIISNDWLASNYKKENLLNQPDSERIIRLIEKTLKYENKKYKKN